VTLGLLLLAVLPLQAATLADARAAERAGAWNDAAAAYEVLAEDGSGPAVRRLAWLAVRRDADGDWDALETLDRSRRGLGVEGAEGLLVQVGAAPLVRSEAALWLAGQALDAGDAAGAVALSDDVWAARDSLPRPVLGQAVRLRADALGALGRYDEAQAVEEVLAIDTSAQRPSRTDRIERAARHQAIGVASGLVATLVVLGLLPGAWRGWRLLPRPRPWGLVPLVLLLLGTAVIVELRDDGTGRWGLPLTLGAVGLHLLSAGAARGQGRLARTVVGVAAAVATLAVAWICLWKTDTLSAVGL
jgi:hypothetical protein